MAKLKPSRLILLGLGTAIGIGSLALLRVSGQQCPPGQFYCASTNSCLANGSSCGTNYSLCTGNSTQDQYDQSIISWVAKAKSQWGMPAFGIDQRNGTRVDTEWLIKGQISIESSFNQNSCSCNGGCGVVPGFTPTALTCPCACAWGYGCWSTVPNHNCCYTTGSHPRDVGLMQIDVGDCNQQTLQFLGLTPMQIATSADANVAAGVRALSQSISGSFGNYWNALIKYCGCGPQYAPNVFDAAENMLSQHHSSGCTGI